MIILHSDKEISSIRSSCRILSEVFRDIVKLISPGVSTSELDVEAEKMIRQNGAEPAFKGYKGFPASVCVSINEVVVHGIPGPRILKEGDIVSLDMGAKFDGYFSDAAITVPVGKIAPELEKLLKITREALFKGIAEARVGNRLSDISHAVQTCVESNDYSVVRDFVGHGIGSSLHEEPQIPNFGEPGRGPRLKLGMVLAIEPMVNIGKPEIRIEDDKWTVVTADGKPSAHFEHTIAVTDGEPEILTNW